jgi:hypothetical protein
VKRQLAIASAITAIIAGDVLNRTPANPQPSPRMDDPRVIRELERR